MSYWDGPTNRTRREVPLDSKPKPKPVKMPLPVKPRSPAKASPPVQRSPPVKKRAPSSSPSLSLSEFAYTASQTAQHLRDSGWRDGTDEDDDEYEEDKFCTCRAHEDTFDLEDVVKCLNRGCKIEYFHLTCMDLPDHPPRGIGWNCPSCRMVSASDVCRDTGLYDQRHHDGGNAWKNWMRSEGRIVKVAGNPNGRKRTTAKQKQTTLNKSPKTPSQSPELESASPETVMESEATISEPSPTTRKRKRDVDDVDEKPATPKRQVDVEDSSSPLTELESEEYDDE